MIMQRLISFGGLFVLMGLAWLMSSHKKRVNLRMIVGGLSLQFVLAALVLGTVPGKKMFDGINVGFEHLNEFVQAGSNFVFGMDSEQESYRKELRKQAEDQGSAATEQAETPSQPRRTRQLMSSFAFGVLPTIVFFASLMGILYHLGIMQLVVTAMARLMQYTLGVSGAESLAAAANVFVGHTEAPLVIRPYLSKLTLSELNAVMVGGFATVTGGLLVAYHEMGISAGHLVTASVISAPAALLVAKLMQPEVDTPETRGTAKVQVSRTGSNLIEAAAIGATDGLKLAVNVGVMLLAFLALIAMANAGIGWIGSWFGQTWSLEAGLGVLFAPIGWVMGIPWEECRHAGQLLGLKMVTNEFLAYDQLGQWLQEDSTVQISQRTQNIMIYALSGFSNFGAIGIQLGGIGGLAPDRRTDLAKLGLRAMIGGTIACCMTACVAGVLIG
ncbi:MAG: nucleoside transporter C-terminal domain-containing protein [Planctomycetota bacterium]|nr:nucleoside transporter C-terminal domain-containing protein [Planctomycetota bacterium]